MKVFSRKNTKKIINIFNTRGQSSVSRELSLITNQLDRAKFEV